eukprot:UC1_evm1s1857
MGTLSHYLLVSAVVVVAAAVAVVASTTTTTGTKVNHVDVIATGAVATTTTTSTSTSTIASRSTASAVPGLSCDLLEACLDPSSCTGLGETPPPHFRVLFETTAGSFNMSVTTAWAPPYAQRAWDLARLSYWQNARFYRVDSHAHDENHNKNKHGNGAKTLLTTPPFVVQFGYAGQPQVDACWDANRTSNATWPPARSNVRGMVSFSMDAAVPSAHYRPNCTSSKYCAVGFSTNIFVNYGNNSRLDAPGFAPIGVIDDPGMAVVDKLYAGYGEVADLCPVGASDPFCVGTGLQCEGVNMTTLVQSGNAYLEKGFPRLDYIRHVSVYV